MIWENSKNQFGQPKKVDKIFIVLKIRPSLRDNPRSAPVSCTDTCSMLVYRCDAIDESKFFCIQVFFLLCKNIISERTEQNNRFLRTRKTHIHTLPPTHIERVIL